MAVNTKQTKENELDKKTINGIKAELLERKKSILEDLDNISSKYEHVKDEYKAKFPEYGNKSDENAQEINEYSTNLAAEKVLEKTLRDINNALERIDQGVYGICKYCKKSIGKKRMLARPVASACIKCKTKLQNS